MPVYAYVCDACSEKFEKLMPSFLIGNKTDVIPCPACGEVGRCRRVWHTVGYPIFKGTGFYKTDYPNDRPKEAVSKPTGSAPPVPNGG